MMRNVINQAATVAGSLEAAENAFRNMFCISAAISLLAIGLAAIMPERPLRGRLEEN